MAEETAFAEEFEVKTGLVPGEHVWNPTPTVSDTCKYRCSKCDVTITSDVLPPTSGCPDFPPVKAKVKEEPTWYCVHCQRPALKRSMVLYDDARVCHDPECLRVVVLEDRYSATGSSK